MGDEQRSSDQSIEERDETSEAPPTGDKSDKRGDKMRAAGMGVAAGAAAVGLAVEALGGEPELASAELDSADRESIPTDPGTVQASQADTRSPITSESAARAAVVARPVAQPLDPIVVTAGANTSGETTLGSEDVRIGAPPGFDGADDADMSPESQFGATPEDDALPDTTWPVVIPPDPNEPPSPDAKPPDDGTDAGTDTGETDDNVYIIDDQVIDLDAIGGENVVYGQTTPNTIIPDEPVPDVQPSSDPSAQNTMDTDDQDDSSEATEDFADDA